MSRFSSLSRVSTLLPAIAFLFASMGSVAQAQAVYDAQVPFSLTPASLNQPTGIAIAPDGTAYVAANGSVYRIQPAASVSGASGSAASIAAQSTALTPSGVTLQDPAAVAVDSAGHLYIADPTGHQLVEMPSPETNSSAQLITYKSGTENPTALAVDSAGNLYIADETAHAIYKYAAGVVTQLPISPANLEPVGVAVDAAGDVYFADAVNDAIYKFTAGTTSQFMTSSATWPFGFGTAPSPIGMGFDPAGHLYVLLNSPGSQPQMLEINPANPSSSIGVPVSLSTGGNSDILGGAAVGTDGNLYLADQTANTIIKLYYNNNPVDFGSLPAGTASGTVALNYSFLSADSGLTLYQSMQGDNTGEFVQTGSNTCSSAQTAGTQCSLTFEVDFQNTTPGLRSGVFGLTDNNGDIMTVPAMGISQAGAMSLYLYPGNLDTVEDSSTPTKIYEPQGLAVTGNGGTLFVADEGGPTSNYSNSNVYAYTNGTGSPKPVGYSGAFSTPTALAVDAGGNLYVAQYNGIIKEVVQPWTSSPQPVSLPGVTLDHPIALAFDPSGNLYIGDTGPAGMMASTSSPGFIVKVPADGGPAVILHFTVNGQPIIFPQALTFDPEGNLYIADGGDGVNTTGGVDVVYSSALAGATSAGNIPAVALPFNGSYQLVSPSGLGIDAAGDLYVLDGFNQRILVTRLTYDANGVPSIGSIGYLGGLGGPRNLIQSAVTASNMVLWPGGNKITIADIGYTPAPGAGTGTPAKVFTLDATTAHVNVPIGSGANVTGSASITGVDVGNEPITFAIPGQIGSSDFSLPDCGSAGFLVSPGVDQSCNVEVKYSGPGYTGVGNRSSLFSLNSSVNSASIYLGNRIFATISPEDPWGTLSYAGGGSGIGILTLTNVGNEELDVTGVSTADFSVISDSCMGLQNELQTGQSCTVYLNVTGVHVYSKVSVTDNAGNSPQSIELGCLFGGCIVWGNNTQAAVPTTAALISPPAPNTNRPGPPSSALGSSGSESSSFFSLEPWEAGPAPVQNTSKGNGKHKSSKN